MNNQAAQTMPELPEPEVLLHSPTHGHVYGYTTEQMRAYGDARYAAALSQTAGVAEGMVMVQKHDLEWIVAHVLDECDGSGPCADLAARRVRALLAAAPAASGGDSRPDALPDGTLSKSMVKRVEALAAASVSERARELLAAEYERDGFDPVGAQQIRDGFVNNTTATALRALEQALTQPSDAERERNLLAEAIGNAGIKCGILRKDIEGLTGPQLLMVCDDMAEALTQQPSDRTWASPFGPCVCLGMNECPGCNPNEAIAMARDIATNAERRKHPPCDECGAKTLAEAETMCHCSGDKDDCHGCELWPGTTPQPSADAARELVRRILDWQPLTSINKADRLYQILVAAGLPFERVTDELESLLGRGGL